MPTPKDFKDRFYPAQQAAIVSEETLGERLGWADDHSSADETATKFEVAYTYLAAADYLQRIRSFKRAADNYHFAGHQLRSVDNLKNAAEAYFKGGEAAEHGAAAGVSRVEQLKWAVRSYARAMVCFSDVGETDEASKAYVAQQNARRKLAWATGKLHVGGFLELLRLTSRYGQSAGQLVLTVAVVTGAYGWIYHTLKHTFSSAVQSDWNGWWSGVYYAVAIAVSFDPAMLEPTSWPTKWVALSNVVVAWVLLGVGAALVARRVKER